jgi:hypothetical protein
MQPVGDNAGGNVITVRSAKFGVKRADWFKRSSTPNLKAGAQQRSVTRKLYRLSVPLKHTVYIHKPFIYM